VDELDNSYFGEVIVFIVIPPDFALVKKNVITARSFALIRLLEVTGTSSFKSKSDLPANLTNRYKIVDISSIQSICIALPIQNQDAIQFSICFPSRYRFTVVYTDDLELDVDLDLDM
jgi:hypothetical protein